MANEALDIELSTMEIDAIGEVMNISMGSAATAVSTMLDKKVDITTPRVSIQQLANAEYAALEPALAVKITYTEGLDGTNVMVFRKRDIQMILNQLMGIDEPIRDDFEFDDLSMSAACEVMNQMMGASATALSEFLGRTVNISTPEAREMSSEYTFTDAIGISEDSEIVCIQFNMDIQGVMTTEFISAMSIVLAKDMVGAFLKTSGYITEPEPEPAAPPMPEPAPAPAPAAAPPPAPAPDPMAAMAQQAPPMAPPPMPGMPPMGQQMPGMDPMAGMTQQMPGFDPMAGTAQQMPGFDPMAGMAQQMPPMAQPPMSGMPPMAPPPMPDPQMGMPPQGYPYYQGYPQQPGYPPPYYPPAYPPYPPYPAAPERDMSQPPVRVQNVRYPEFGRGGSPTGDPVLGGNADLLMNVPLDVTIEIGQARRKIKDILAFSQGSVIELEKQAGAPVDIVVNGQLIAHGDVVVIDDNFGVRITEILGTRDLLNSLTEKS